MPDEQNVALLMSEKKTISRIKATFQKTSLSIKTFHISHISELTELIKRVNIEYLLLDQSLADRDFQSVLKYAKENFPHIIRVFFIEKWSQELIIILNDTAHLICEKRILESGIRDLFIKTDRLKKLLQNKDLVNVINTFQVVPVLRTEYIELLHHLQMPHSSLKMIGELVEKDIALSSKVLQTINFSVYAYSGRITSVRQAVIYLGVNVLKALLIHIQVFQLKTKHNLVIKRLHVLEKHSLMVAMVARRLSEILTNDAGIQEDCYTAGLLHDIGQFVLLSETKVWEQIIELIDQQGIESYEAEEKVIKTSHETIGAYLLSLWGFPNSIVDAIAYHHKPRLSDSKKLGLPTIIYIAESILDGEKVRDEEAFLQKVDLEYLADLGIKHHVIAAHKAIYAEFGNPKEEPKT